MGVAKRTKRKGGGNNVAIEQVVADRLRFMLSYC
jgi:hypothetical protein